MSQKIKFFPAFFVLIATLLIAGCKGYSSKPFERDTYTTASGKKIVVIPIKHASLQIVYNGKQYQIDPVSSYVRPIIDYTDKPKADYIIITDVHKAHFDPYAIALLTKNTTNIILPLRCYNKLSRTTLQSLCTVMPNGYRAELDSMVTLYSVAAYDTSRTMREHYPKGIGNGYVLEIENKRIYIAGTTQVLPDTAQLGHIDIAFLPCMPPRSFTIAQFQQVISTLQPDVVYPYAYGDTPADSLVMTADSLATEVKIRALY